MKQILLFSVLVIVASTHAYGQAEYVPVSNPVYDFLDRMHRLGMVTSYSRAMLPIERKTVTALLDTIQRRRTMLRGADILLAERYYDEFVREADGSQQKAVLFSSDSPGASWITNDHEKYLYSWSSADRSTTIQAEFLASGEYRARFAENRTTNVSLGSVGGRFRGTIEGIVGFGLQSTNGTSFGDKAFALEDRRLRQNPNYTYYQTDFFDFTEAYINGTWAWGNLSLGRQTLLAGNSPFNPTIVSDNASTFDALRLNLHYGDFRFSYIHGFLLSERTNNQENKPYYDAKYLAVHRAEADVLQTLRLGVFESVVYSEREIDPAYLNPFNFYKSAEHAGGDRDNPMLGFDFQTLSLPGFELYGSWTLDDLDFGRWGSDWWGNKFIWQGGVLTSSLLEATELGVEYTRIEPFVYSHFFHNNTYTHDTYIIGDDLPPNSDQWVFSATHWHDHRLMFRITYQYRRHGDNLAAADGTLIKNNGADPAFTKDYLRDGDLAPFLEGPRNEEHLGGLLIRYEPLRNIIVETLYQYLYSSREYATGTPGEMGTVGVNEHHVSLALRLEL